MSNFAKVRLPNGTVVDIIVEEEHETVSAFKYKLTELVGDLSKIRLVVEGRVLKDGDIVLECAKDKVVFVVPDVSSNQPDSASSTIPVVANEREPANPMSAMMGTMLERNPELMKSIITSHPQLKAMMEKSPQLKEAMNNPQVLQDMVKLATNPQYYQEAMRSSDRAMSQLENIPQGFQMLSQLHRQVDTISPNTMTRPLKTNLYGSSPSGRLQTKPLPNPWSPKGARPEQNYNLAMEELKELGFADEERNKQVLKRTNGNVEAALEILFMDAERGSEDDE